MPQWDAALCISPPTGRLSPGTRRRGFFAAGSNGALAEALNRRARTPPETGPDVAHTPRFCQARGFFMRNRQRPTALSYGDAPNVPGPQHYLAPAPPASAGAFFVAHVPRPSRNPRSLGTPSAEAYTPGAQGSIGGDGGWGYCLNHTGAPVALVLPSGTGVKVTAGWMSDRQPLRSKSFGSLAMLIAIRRASSRVSRLAAARRPGSSSACAAPSDPPWQALRTSIGSRPASSCWRHWRASSRASCGIFSKRPIAAHALEFMILTAVRREQAAKARWEDIDFADRIWICLPDAHKTGRKTGASHIVPLSDAAMAIVTEMKEIQKASGQDSEFVFAGRITGGVKSSTGHLTTSMINKFMEKYLKRTDCVPHGFRSTFATWSVEHGYDERDSEMALAHTVGNNVRNIYKREAYRIEPRRLMMQAWAEFCGRSAPLDAKIIPMRQARNGEPT